MNAFDLNSLKGLEPAQLAQKVITWRTFVGDWRRRMEWEWHVNKNFQHGKHHKFWNVYTRRLEERPNPYNRVRATINKIAEKTRSTGNFVIKRRPKWIVSSTDWRDFWVKNAQNIGKYADWYWRTHGVTFLVIDNLLESLDTSLAPTKVFYDYELEDGLGDVTCENLSSFDFYSDPMAGGNIQNGRFVDTCTRVPLSDIHTNPRYDPKERVKVKGDSKLAASEWKETMEQNKYGAQIGGGIELDTALVDECYIRIYRDKDIKRIDPKSGEELEVTIRDTQIWLATVAGSRLLRFVPTDLTKFPFACMRTSLNALETYGRPRTSDLIGPQKIYNKLYSLELEHVNLFRGKMIADKNSGVKVIENEAGLIIEKNPGKSLIDAPPQPMGNVVPLIKQSIKRDIDELSGISPQFSGFAQFAGESGKHSEAMQLGSSNNVSDILICFEEYLKDLLELILWNTANYVQVSRLIDIVGNEGQTEFYNVLGGETKTGQERAKELSQMKPREMENKEGPMTIIVPSNAKVTTDVSSWITWSEEEKLDKLIELYRYGIIEDKQTILEALRVGNLAEIIERSEQKRVKEAVAQQRMMAMQQGVQPDKKTNELEIAEFENVAMSKGQDIPPTSDKAPITPKHTMVHTEWTNSDEFKRLPMDRKESIARHVEGEDQYHKERRSAT